MSVRTLAITPAHNEEGSVARVVEGVLSLGIQSLVVDDGSTDDTAAVAQRAGAVVVRLPSNYGVGAALRAGFRYAVMHGFDRVIQIDADLQHDPNVIPTLLEVADRGAHLVIGSRFGSEYDAGARRPAMRLLSRLIRSRTGVEIEDPTSGFKVVTEPLLSEFADSFPAEYLGDTVEALLRASASGAVVAEVRIPMSERRTGSPTPTPRAAAHFGRVLLAIGTGKARRASE